MTVIALIQARMGATRLPGKVLMDLAGKPVLQHVVERIQASKYVDEVVVVTTLQNQDIPIVQWCSTQNVRVFCGAEFDVLDRFYQAAKILDPDVIVRITADCPLMDPDVIDLVVSAFIHDNVDYLNNCGNETWPDGLDVEVFRFSVLSHAWKNAKLPSEREHVTSYIYTHKELFSGKVLDHEPSLKGMRWTLDEKQDYEFISKVYLDLWNGSIFGMNKILELLQRKPALQEINSSIVRNEGYLKSLLTDRVKQGEVG